MKVAGFGFRTSASVESLRDALEMAGGSAGLGAIATLSEKAGSDSILALADAIGVPVRAIPAARLRAMTTQTQSAESLAAHGTGSVAEAAALAAAGEAARLLGSRSISTDRLATCAIATGDHP